MTFSLTLTSSSKEKVQFSMCHLGVHRVCLLHHGQAGPARLSPAVGQPRLCLTLPQPPLTDHDWQHPHGLLLPAVDLGPLPTVSWVGVVEVGVGESLDPIVHHIVHGVGRAGVGAALPWLQPTLLPLNEAAGVVELPVDPINAAPQLGLPRFLPALESSEHGAVQHQHDRAGDEEGADGGVDNVVVILQLTQGGVPVWDIVEAEDDWGSYGEGEDPGGGEQDHLPQVDLAPVVVQRD